MSRDSGHGMQDAVRKEAAATPSAKTLPLSQDWEKGSGGEGQHASHVPHPESRPPTTDPQHELFDILDEHGNRTGQQKARGLVHRDGDWHPALHIWVGGVGSDGVPFVLFQRRSLTKDTWPRALDVAVGGHMRAGETLEETLREAEEEIGLRLSLADLVYIGRRFTDSSHYGTIDREVQEVYAVRSDLPLSSYRLHPEEVDAIASLAIADARRVFAGEIASANALECRRDASVTLQTVRLDDFVQVRGSYISDALDALDAVLAGRSAIPFNLRVQHVS